jgi:TRAP-type C4-dicarboxylate transport system permease small subunit
MRKLDTGLAAFETGFIVILVALLLIAGVTQFILRNIFHSGLLWLEPLSRYLVVWIAFTGALRATAEGRHIKIDIAPRILSGRIGMVVQSITSCAAAILSFLLSRWALSFVQTEREFGDLAFLEVPTWVALAIIPLGFLGIGLRFIIRGAIQFRRVFSSEHS